MEKTGRDKIESKITKYPIQDPSVMTWVAEVEFLDREISYFAGDVTTVKCRKNDSKKNNHFLYKFK